MACPPRPLRFTPAAALLGRYRRYPVSEESCAGDGPRRRRCGAPFLTGREGADGLRLEDLAAACKAAASIRGPAHRNG